MSLAWSIGFAHLNDVAHLGAATLTHLQICWFLAVIIGACIATIFIDKMALRTFNIIAAVLVMVNGIMFISTGDSVLDVVIARYCDGIAFGLTVIPAIVKGSEQSVKRKRGYVLTIEQFALIAGMNVYFIISRNNLLHGILALICGSLALLFSLIYTIESPISYLRKGKEVDAINAPRQLQRLKFLTDENYALLNENKLLLEEDIVRGRAKNVSIGLRPMVKLCLFRAVVSMSLSVPLVWGFIVAAALTDHDDNLWKLYTLTAMRLIGIVFAMYTLDKLGRKETSAISLLVGGGLLLGVGSLFSNYWGLSDSQAMKTAKGLLMAYQLLAGVAAPASTCYLGEAFSISLKPYFILVAVIFENVLQIILCCAFSGTKKSVSDYGYTFGVLQIAFAIFFFFGMPETKQTTLREALVKFTKAGNADDCV